MNSFRPLSGSYISQWLILTSKKMQKFVSVPYRGATFLNGNHNLREWKSILSFRPLSGSYISQYEHGNIKDYMCACFRPLSGSYISQLAIILITLFFVTCFRPLSGSYISQ